MADAAFTLSPQKNWNVVTIVSIFAILAEMQSIDTSYVISLTLWQNEFELLEYFSAKICILIDLLLHTIVSDLRIRYY